MTKVVWFILGAVVGGALALALFAKPLCQRTLSSSSRGWLEGTFGSGLGGFFGDLADQVIAKV